VNNKIKNILQNDPIPNLVLDRLDEIFTSRELKQILEGAN
jgi:hypothetical protein